MARRSVLIAPGDQSDKLRKALRSDAEVVVFDLEDGVHPDRKGEAREQVRRVLSEVDADAEVCVRVNPVGDGARDDVATVVTEVRPDSVMLPKTANAKEVEALENLTLPILALVETAQGVLAADEIAAAEPTDALVFGAEDLAGDLGATRSADGSELAYPHQRVLVAARAAGVDAIDTHYPEYQDLEGLRRDAERALRLGYDGKLAIHPGQVEVLNEAFTPDEERLSWARRVLEASESAAAEGAGVFVVDGEMIDAPQVRRAERILERAGERPPN